jgi:hypothetical protein
VKPLQESPKEEAVIQGARTIAGEEVGREKRKKPNWLCSGLQAKSHQRYNWKSNETWNEIMMTVQKEGRQQNVVSDDGVSRLP